MKRLTIASILVVTVAVLACAEGSADPADRFVATFSGWLVSQKHSVTPEEKDALRKVHRLLVLASRDAIIRRYFWSTVSESETKEIEWSKAKDMILAGQAISVGQTHALHVSITGRDGVEYRTREPKIDEVLRLLEEVDPKRVFISFATE